MFGAIGGGLQTWLNGSGRVLVMSLAGFMAILAGLRGHWHRAAEIVGATFLGLFIIGMSAHSGDVSTTLATLF